MPEAGAGNKRIFQALWKQRDRLDLSFGPTIKPSPGLCIGERCSLLYEPHLNDLLLSLIEEAERLSEESTPFCPTIYGMK